MILLLCIFETSVHYIFFHTGNYATLFNLGHPEIWKQIEEPLKNAQECMRKGKKFCVEVSANVLIIPS